MDSNLELVWRSRILRSAIYDQKCLVEIVPRLGMDPTPYEDNLTRLRVRLFEVTRKLEGQDGSH